MFIGVIKSNEIKWSNLYILSVTVLSVVFYGFLPEI